MSKYKAQGEVWRQSISVPQLLVSSEGRVMVAPYWGDLPRGGQRSYGGQPHFGIWDKPEARFIVSFRRKTYKVHCLVCEAFQGHRPDIEGQPAVCMHMDENSANNRADNLKWGSQQENMNAPTLKKYRTHGDFARAQRERQDLARA